MPLIENILKKFNNTIVVDININHFIFSCKSNTLKLETFIDIDDNSGKEKVANVGDDIYTNCNNIRIILFDSNQSIGQRNKLDYLDAFFKYAIMNVTGNRTMIRPKLVFKNINALNQCLSGYQSFVLEEAAKRAGAMECSFV